MSYRKLALSMLAVAMVVSAFASVPAAAEDLPTPQMIINKYVKATGGEDAWKNLHSRVMKGNLMVVAMGMSGTMEMYVEPPNARQVMSLEGFGEFVSGINDGVAWSSNMMQGDQILTGAQAEDMKRQADLQFWLHWEKYYPNAETVGEEAVGDATAWKVTFTPEEGAPISQWFDKDSGLLIQSEGPGMGGGPATTTFKDYKEVDGLKFAHTQSIEGGQGPVEITFTEITVNKDIDDSVFEMPDAIKALMTEEEATDDGQ